MLLLSQSVSCSTTSAQKGRPTPSHLLHQDRSDTPCALENPAKRMAQCHKVIHSDAKHSVTQNRYASLALNSGETWHPQSEHKQFVGIACMSNLIPDGGARHHAYPFTTRPTRYQGATGPLLSQHAPPHYHSEGACTPSYRKLMPHKACTYYVCNTRHTLAYAHIRPGADARVHTHAFTPVCARGEREGIEGVCNAGVASCKGASSLPNLLARNMRPHQSP